MSAQKLFIAHHHNDVNQDGNRVILISDLFVDGQLVKSQNMRFLLDHIREICLARKLHSGDVRRFDLSDPIGILVQNLYDCITCSRGKKTTIVGSGLGGVFAAMIAIQKEYNVKNCFLFDPNIDPLLQDGGDHTSTFSMNTRSGRCVLNVGHRNNRGAVSLSFSCGSIKPPADLNVFTTFSTPRERYNQAGLVQALQGFGVKVYALQNIKGGAATHPYSKSLQYIRDNLN